MKMTLEHIGNKDLTSKATIWKRKETKRLDVLNQRDNDNDPDSNKSTLSLQHWNTPQIKLVMKTD